MRRNTVKYNTGMIEITTDFFGVETDGVDAVELTHVFNT